MKKAVVGSLITALLAAGVAVAATTNVVSVNVVGFQKLDIAGGSNTTYTLLSAPMTKIPAVRGTITANGAATISDSTMSWTPGEFATNVSGKEAFGKSTFFVEIASSNAPLAGRHFYIKDNDATTLTLIDSLGVPDNALNTYSYKIVAANRVRDIFGETNAPTLTGGNNAGLSDNILVWNPTSGWELPIWFRTATKNWIQNSIIVNDKVIDRDEGFLVKRLAGATSTNLTVAGEVSGNLQSIVLDGTAYSLVGGMSVVDVPINQSGLTNSLASGNNAGLADNVLFWTPGVGWSLPVWRRTSTGLWMQNGVDVSSTFIIRAGQGYLILKRGATAEWDRKSPL